VRLYDAISGAIVNVLAKDPSLDIDDVMDRHKLVEALAHELRTGPWRAVKAEDVVPKKRWILRAPVKLLKRRKR